MFAKLALSSLLDRKGSVVLSLMAMTISIFVLLGVEHIRHQAKENFANTVSGVDLIVGAKTGSLNLLLYSVFKIGTPTNNISWQSFEKISASSKVKWAIPISLGDSHKGFRVLGTTQNYFQYFSYGKKHHLLFDKGQVFNNVFDVVLGSQVAKKLGYQLGDKIVLAHGIAKTSFSLHKKNPFTVVGILSPTGTPVDQTLHVSLQGIEAVHTDLQHAHTMGSKGINKEFVKKELQPKSITAFMLALESKIMTFKVQRDINNYTKEPLLAILPGVALSELWQMMSILENTLLLVSILVFFSACLGVSAMLLSSIRERSREIELLRVIGASPSFLFLLIELEAVFIAVFSIVLGSGLLVVSLWFSQEYLMANFGLQISLNIFSVNSMSLIMAMLSASIIVAFIPSFTGYIQAKAKNLMQ
jgi:putative ABC transport system permease protein